MWAVKGARGAGQEGAVGGKEKAGGEKPPREPFLLKTNALALTEK